MFVHQTSGTAGGHVKLHHVNNFWLARAGRERMLCAMEGEERKDGPGHLIIHLDRTSSLLPPVVQVRILPVPRRLAACENAACVVRQGPPWPMAATGSGCQPVVWHAPYYILRWSLKHSVKQTWTGSTFSTNESASRVMRVTGSQSRV
jgi:hypothetical protein